jgi:glycosyltransferase involved in cell wall biosynthesis
MKVLHFYRTYYPDSLGGIEQVIFQLCQGVAQFGVESEVLTLSKNCKNTPLVLRNHVIHQAKLNFQLASTGFSLSSFKLFSELSRQADIVHYHYPWPFMDVVHFATRLKKPTVVTYHSDIIRQKLLLKLYRPLHNRFLASVDRIVATSPNYLATSPVLNCYRDKTVVISIGLDKSAYPVPSSASLVKWRSLVGDRFFLFIGMIRYYKGLHILLEAVKGTDFPVVIVGSGPVEAELKKHCAALGLKKIYFLGALPDEDKVALLQLCYAVAFPSHLRSEAFGISLLEGAMYGKPMISSEIGTGTSYINVHGQTGLIVPPSNPDAFREAMRMLWRNPDMAADMGRQAEQRYWELFTADRMAASYVELYKELLSANGHII